MTDYLSVCAIVKDENSYLPEWIEYHRLVGVDRFYIYDNGSAVPVAESLSKDVAEGLVRTTSFPGPRRQMSAYLQCAKEHRKRTLWIAFIDIDEFLVPKSGDMRGLLREYERFSGLALNWRVFGSSGHAVRPAGLQAENFTMAEPSNPHVKTVAKAYAVSEFVDPHHCRYPQGHFCVDTSGRPVAGPFNDPPQYGRAQVNHYFTRSRAEFAEKTLRGSAGGSAPKKPEFFDLVENNCSFRDESIMRFVPALREAVARRTG